MPKGDPTDNAVQRTRAWAGVWIIILGDAAIAGAAIYGIFRTGGNADDARVSILTSAFTAIGTMTAAYFGIRAASNTAQAAVPRPPAGQPPPAGPPAAQAAVAGPPAGQPPPAGPPAAQATVAGPPAGQPPPATTAEQPAVEEVGEPQTVASSEIAKDVDQSEDEQVMTDPTVDPDIDTNPLPPELTDEAAQAEEPATPVVDEDDDTEFDDPDTEDDPDEDLDADVVEADNDEQGAG